MQANVQHAHHPCAVGHAAVASSCVQLIAQQLVLLGENHQRGARGARHESVRRLVSGEGLSAASMQREYCCLRTRPPQPRRAVLWYHRCSSTPPMQHRHHRHNVHAPFRPDSRHLLNPRHWHWHWQEAQHAAVPCCQAPARCGHARAYACRGAWQRRRRRRPLGARTPSWHAAVRVPLAALLLLLLGLSEPRRLAMTMLLLLPLVVLKGLNCRPLAARLCMCAIVPLPVIMMMIMVIYDYIVRHQPHRGRLRCTACLAHRRARLPASCVLTVACCCCLPGPTCIPAHTPCRSTASSYGTAARKSPRTDSMAATNFAMLSCMQSSRRQHCMAWTGNTVFCFSSNLATTMRCN